MALDFPYGHTTGLRRVAPAAEAVSAADQASYDALRREYDELEAEYEGAEELPDAVDARLGELEQALARFGRGPREADRGRPYACSAIQTGLEDRWHRPPPQQRIAGEVGAEEGLRVEAALGVSEGHPADRHGGPPSMVPNGSGGVDLDDALAPAIPTRHRDALPRRSRVDQRRGEVRQARALAPGRPRVPGLRGGAGS